jgi:hypothetical protein
MADIFIDAFLLFVIGGMMYAGYRGAKMGRRVARSINNYIDS